MKRLIAFFMSLTAGMMLSAQNDVSKVLSKIDTNRIYASYECTVVQNNVPVFFSGEATVQGNCFKLSGNGLELFCDGEKLVYVDPESREVYVEDAIKLEEYIMANIGSVKDIKLSEVKYSAVSDDLSAFRLDTAALDKSWVVTDLR